MTDWSIWPATNGPNTDAGDSSDISRGVIFRLSAPGWLKAIRFYRGTTNVGNWTGGAPIGRLYTLVDGLPVSATDVTFTPSGTGWQQANLPTPKPLSAGVSYKAVVLTGNYTATGGYFASGAGVGGIVNGILTCPDAGGNPSGIGPIQQMSFKQPTTGLEFPNQYFNGGNYWVDVVIADTDPGTDIRDVAGSVDASAVGVLATMDGKIGITSPSLPVAVDVAAAFLKTVDLAVGLPVAVGVTGVDEKVSTSAPTLPVTATVTATVESSGAGVHAPVSDVLCSSWANFVDVPLRLRERLPTVSEADWQDNLMLASELLWMMSGRRWYGGGCTESALLRSSPPQEGRGTWPYDSSWGRCGCWNERFSFWSNPEFQHVAPFAIQLPRSPITNIVSVVIDGVTFTDYVMLRDGWIERTDGQRWSMCDNSTLVTYQYGEPPPRAGKNAAITLAYELGLEQTGDGECRLPSLVTSITRQGVTITRQTATDFQEVQRTGLPEVDRWLSAVNPESRQSRGTVWSPDLPSAVRTPQ